MTPETKIRAAVASPARLSQPPCGERAGRCSGRAMVSPVAVACRTRAAALHLPVGSRGCSWRQPMLSRRPLAVSVFEPGYGIDLAGGLVLRVEFSALAVGSGTRPRRQERSGDEIRQQAARARGFGRFRIAPVSGRACGKRPLLEHPAREKGQRRLFHHFVEQNGQLPPQISHMFQFGHLEIPKGSIRAFTKIILRRCTEPSHRLPPVGVGFNTVRATSPKRNTEGGLCKSSFACGKRGPLNAGAGQSSAGAAAFR